MTVQGRVVLFTGPSAAGKTTIAEAWARGRSARTAYFDHDQARFIMRAGYVSRTAARVDELPGEQPNFDLRSYIQTVNA
jgi:adenylylsulfate kinase-like enzyme